MAEINPEENFEPSRDTKRVWRFTRKAPRIYPGLTLPGLFDTSNFTLDTALFLTVIILEIWGLVNLLSVGQFNPIYAVFLFLLDLFFAIVRHLPIGNICELKNRLVYEDDVDEQTRIQKRISRSHFTSELFAIPIILIAVFKIISFYALQGGTINGLTAGVMVSYAIAALLHIKVTGYFLFGLLTDIFWWRDHNRFLRQRDNLNINNVPNRIVSYLQHPFKSSIPLKEARFYKHSLDLISSASGANPSSSPYEYTFKTWGILFDNQLHNLITQQGTTDAKIVVAREGVRHQVIDILPK